MPVAALSLRGGKVPECCPFDERKLRIRALASAPLPQCRTQAARIALMIET